MIYFKIKENIANSRIHECFDFDISEVLISEARSGHFFANNLVKSLEK